MSVFSFNFNINLIYVLIYWILNIFLRILIDYKNEELFLISKENIAEDEYIFAIYNVISNLMNGFLILYVHYSTKRQLKVQNKNKTKLIYKNPLKRRNKFFYLKLILISCIELFNLLCYFIFFALVKYSKEEDISKKCEKDIITFIDIIIRYLFSIFMLKTKVYKHHLWSIFAIIFGFILIIPLDIIGIINEKDKNNVYSMIYIGILSFTAVLFPLRDTLIKKFYKDYYILPEKLLFFLGIIEIFLSSILTAALYFSQILIYKLTFTFWNVFMSLIFILINFVKQYIVAKIIYLFSSQSVSFLIISTTIAEGIEDIVDFFQNKDKNSVVFYFGLFFGIISIIIIFIGTMVYDEIIIVNKFGLNRNVKRGIHERALIEVESTLDDIDDVDKSDIILDSIEMI